VSTLVEVICYNSLKNAQKEVEQRLEQIGDRLLARCAYEELDRVLLVAQFAPRTDEREHSAFLLPALHHGMIESYEFMTSYPVSALLNPTLDREQLMRLFPLRDGESWFPAIDHPNKVYICLDKPFMASNQTLWLMKYQVRWEFEDI
jgi:hypothetical protein